MVYNHAVYLFITKETGSNIIRTKRKNESFQFLMRDHFNELISQCAPLYNHTVKGSRLFNIICMQINTRTKHSLLSQCSIIFLNTLLYNHLVVYILLFITEETQKEYY